MSDDLPVSEGLPGHVASEFYLWLWFISETGGGTLTVEDAAPVQFWVEDRLAFRPAGEEKATAVLTGDNPGSAPEARAAVRGGKLLREVRLALRREEREYAVTLRGPVVEISGAKLPALLKAGDPAEILYERMFLYEELHWIVAHLFRRFASVRAGDSWARVQHPEMVAWLAGRDPA